LGLSGFYQTISAPGSANISWERNEAIRYIAFRGETAVETYVPCGSMFDPDGGTAVAVITGIVAGQDICVESYSRER